MRPRFAFVEGSKLALPVSGFAELERRAVSLGIVVDLKEFDCTGGPGFAAGRSEAGKLTEAHCTGLASVEFEAPIGPETPMNLGSVSKQFTVWAVALLEDAGELSFDDAATRHLPVPEIGATLLDLANHTNPFVDFPHWFYLRGADSAFATRREVASATNDGSLIAMNRSRGFLYSNTGYVMLAEVVRRVSGQKLAAFAAEHMFAPLGMARTAFRDDVRAVMPGRAGVYDAEGTRAFDAGLTEETIGPGGLYSTLEDWAHWEANALENCLGNDPAAVSARLRGPEPIGEAGSRYYCGMRRTWLGQSMVEGHLGGFLGYTSFHQRVGDVAILVMANGPRATAADVGFRLVVDLTSEPIRDGYLPDVGIYRNRETGILRRIVDGCVDGRAIMSLGPAAREGERGLLFYPTETGFREVCLGPSYDLEFEPIHPWTPENIDEYVGMYYSPRLANACRIDVSGDELVMEFNGEQRPMSPVSKDTFDAAARLSVCFRRDSGRVAGLEYGTNRIPVVDFARVS